MPYEIQKKNGKYCVINQKTGEMVPGGDHATRADAAAHMRALYANVKDGEDGTWVVIDWFTGETVATLIDENAAQDIHDVMLESGQLTDAEFSAQERSDLAKKGQAMPDGSFPTPTKQYWFKARQAIGRAANAAKRSSVITYLKRRAKALGIPDSEIPDGW